MTEPEPLPDLLRRAALRDEAAARALVEALGPLLRRIIHSHSSLRDDAEDLMQDIFFRLFRSADQYRGEAPVEHWAARIARCTCIDRLRRKKTRAAELRWSDLPPAQQRALTECAAAEITTAPGEDAAALLAQLFATLAPRDAWLLREAELRERPLAVIAAEAGWSGVLTRVRLFRARRRLCQAFEKLNTPPP